MIVPPQQISGAEKRGGDMLAAMPKNTGGAGLGTADRVRYQPSTALTLREVLGTATDAAARILPYPIGSATAARNG